MDADKLTERLSKARSATTLDEMKAKYEQAVAMLIGANREAMQIAEDACRQTEEANRGWAESQRNTKEAQRVAREAQKLAQRAIEEEPKEETNKSH